MLPRFICPVIQDLLSQILDHLEKRRRTELRGAQSIHEVQLKTDHRLFFLTLSPLLFPVQTLPPLSCHYATKACSQKQPPSPTAVLLFKQTASPPSVLTDGWRTQINETETQPLFAACWVLFGEKCR